MAYFLFRVLPAILSLNRADSKSESDAQADVQELCLTCGYDARGLSRCPECGAYTATGRRQKLARLRNEWPGENIIPRQPGDDELPVVILNTGNRGAADLLRQHLEARGVLAKLNRGEQPGLAAYTPSHSDYRLTVWSEDAERARAIVQHLWPEDARG